MAKTKTKQQLLKEIEQMQNELAQRALNEVTAKELCSFGDYVKSSYSSGASVSDVKLTDLYNWLRNPQKYLQQLVTLSKYYYAKDGIITDVYDMFKTLPILNSSVMWENMQMKKFAQYKKQADIFLKNINPKKLARDTIFSVIEDGFCVWYNRQNKYIQFLDYDSVKINTMVNGKWQVKFDLAVFDRVKNNVALLEEIIESAPEEVTLADYNAYKKDRNKRYKPLDVNRTQVFKLRGDRNTPTGIPYAVGAFSSIIHKDLLEKTEKVLADRIINQILIQKVGYIGGKDGKPPTKEQIQNYHSALKQLLQSKDSSTNSDQVGTAPLTVPEWVTIEELAIKMNVFEKEVYERIDRNIYQKLGYSPALSIGGGEGASFGAGTINTEKIFSIIHFLLEDIEDAITDYLNQIVPSNNFNPSIRFSRSTLIDKEIQVKHNKELYLEGRGSLRFWVESVGHNFDHWLSQVKYENEVLKLDEVLVVHPTSYTKSAEDDPGGRPTDPKTKDGNGSNNIPSPSDE